MLFVVLIVNFAIFGSTHCALINLANMFNAFANVTGDFLQADKNIEQGFLGLYEKSFDKLIPTLSQNFNLLNAGYALNAEKLLAPIQALLQLTSNNEGIINIPSTLANSIEVSQANTVAGFRNLVEVNKLLQAMLIAYKSQLAIPSNIVPKSLLSDFTNIQSLLTSAYQKMQTSKSVAFRPLIKYATDGIRKLIQQAVQESSNDGKAYRANLKVIQSVATRLKGQSSMNARTFLSIFNQEMKGLGKGFSAVLSDIIAVKQSK